MTDGGRAPTEARWCSIIDKELQMNSASSTSDPPDAAVDAGRRLIRPTEGRVVAGVAAGLADYFGISATVYRVAFAALVLLGGSGIILYAAAWLVIPDERRGASVVEEAIRDRRSRPWLALGVFLVGVGLVFGIAGSHVWADPGRSWLPALAVGLAIVWWQLQDRDRRATVNSSSAGDAGTGSTTVVAGGPAKRRIPVFLPVLGVLIAGAGILGLLDATDTVDVNWTIALAGGVVLVGIAVAVGAFFGGVGALAALGAVLAAILLAVATIDVPLHGPIGDRTVHPTSMRSLESTYRQSIGQLDLDLSDLQLPPGTTKVTASVGIGQLTVLVPRNVAVEATADVTAGQTRLFGVEDNGWNVDHATSRAGVTGDSPVLVLDTKAGLGQIEVRRG